jgi:hypothetical protein
MTGEPPRMDVLMCVGEADVDRLMPFALRSCILGVPWLRRIYVVTNVPARVEKQLEQHALRQLGPPVEVRSDFDVLPTSLHARPGWWRQQVIRLHADQICGQQYVACMSADTLVFAPLKPEDLFEAGRAITYYNRYPYPSAHLEYERGRVEKVAKLLRVQPTRSLPLGDFIMDFKVLEAEVLSRLRGHLQSLYGPQPFASIIPATDDPSLRDSFGEWTAYSVFLLDVLGGDVPTRNSENLVFAQVHSEREWDLFSFDAKVVHFVDKRFPVERVVGRWKEAPLNHNSSKGSSA